MTNVQILSILPLLTATLLILMNKKTCHAMFVGTLLGLGVYILIPNLALTPFTIKGYVQSVLIDNASTLISIYILGFLMYLITMSSAINDLANSVQSVLNTPQQVTISIPIIGTLLSQDDYLTCMATGTIITPLSQRVGLKKEMVAFLINLTAISACCISPISSWSPVIKSALSTSQQSTTLSIYTIPANLTVLLFIITIIWLCFNPTKVSNNVQILPKHNISYTKTHIGCYDLLITFTCLIVLYFFFSGYCTTFSPLIPSCFFACGVATILFLKDNLLTKNQLKDVFKENLLQTTQLAQTLISIWSIVTISNKYLGLSSLILSIYDSFNISYIFVPTFVFAMAAVFSFLTGSAYGSFGLFISIASSLALQMPATGKTITIAAAISGSLFATFSLSSDTTLLCAEKTSCNLAGLRQLQFSYVLPIFVSGMIGYLIFGIADYNRISYTSCIPLCIMFYMQLLFIKKLHLAYKYINMTRYSNYNTHTSARGYEYYCTDLRTYLNSKLVRLYLYYRRKCIYKHLKYYVKCPCK